MSMKPLVPPALPALPTGGLERVERDVKRLEEQWARDGDVSLERFWDQCSAGTGSDPAGACAHLGALIKADLRCRFERGETAQVTDYLGRFPVLRGDDSRIVSLIYEEFCLREERGDPLNVETFCELYPDWRDSLTSQLQYHRLFSKAAGLNGASPRFPEAGTQFEEFELTTLIGKGGSSRVFLARDLSLGGKRVVLKVSIDRGQEPKTQGALDHPHIVPVNSVAFQPEEGLRGLSMPYRPGLPLDEILKKVRPANQPRLARALWDHLVAAEAPGLPPLTGVERAELYRTGPLADGWRGFPLKGTYSEGAAWIIMILARTLHYAHGTRTFHRDVKPGNIMLTFQHGPQLLDFNLSDSPHATHHAEAATLGGTLPYMAPEQIQAFVVPELWSKVGARSDIYSLGLVLRELLTGQAPDLPNEKLPLPRAIRDLLDRRSRINVGIRQWNPDVPYALEAITRRCLSFDTDQRYADAQSLADDLERFLSRKPLEVAVNPCRSERAGNWIHRNRRSLVHSALYLTLVGLLAFPWIARRLKPPLESSPVFRKAIRAIENDQAASAIGPLRDLVRQYPDHRLPGAYLGIAEALSKGLTENPAQVSMREDLDLPGSETTLFNWAQRTPSLARHLSDFAKAQLDHINDYKSKHPANQDSTGQAAPRDDDGIIEDRYYDTLSKSLRLALKIDPGSQAIRRQMAAVEEYRKNFESASQILGELIQTARARSDRQDRDNLIGWTTQRGRVVVRWSSELRKSGEPAGTNRALELLRQSLQDLERCQRDVSDLETQHDLLFPGVWRIYSFHWITTETWLEQGEVERARGDDASALAAVQQSKRVLDRLDAFGKEHALKRPADFEILRQRIVNWLRAGPAGPS
jgi:serine/threonine protein kinase